MHGIDYPEDLPGHVEAELSLYRDFYNAWKDLHSTPPDQRRKAERAAQRLVEASETIDRMLAPPLQLPGILQ